MKLEQAGLAAMCVAVAGMIAVWVWYIRRIQHSLVKVAGTIGITGSCRTAKI